MVKAWKQTRDEWILTSNLREDACFKDPPLARELTRGNEWFLGD
jgi:hypothetical protein